MSKLRKISTVVMALVLVLCVGYFSLMSTTSAWFYSSGVIDSGDSFIFGDLSVDTSFRSKSKIVFDAATKLADEDEIFFDEVVNVEEIVVCNSGTVPARIYADADIQGNSDGFRWFFYSDVTAAEGGVKETIRASLPELTDEALEKYNVGEDGKSGHYVLLDPGELTTVKIASWIEYDEVADELENKGSLDSYDVEFTLITTQDVDSAAER